MYYSTVDSSTRSTWFWQDIRTIDFLSWGPHEFKPPVRFSFFYQPPPVLLPASFKENRINQKSQWWSSPAALPSSRLSRWPLPKDWDQIECTLWRKPKKSMTKSQITTWSWIQHFFVVVLIFWMSTAPLCSTCSRICFHFLNNIKR